MNFEMNDTIELMTSENYKERIKAEYYQLTIRINKLEEMLDKYKGGSLEYTPKSSYPLLNRQYQAMIQYSYYLETVADIEGIELEQ